MSFGRRDRRHQWRFPGPIWTGGYAYRGIRPHRSRRR